MDRVQLVLALVEDIRANGLACPITLWQGKILDGRNCYRACIKAGAEPEFEDLVGDVDPHVFVYSMNVHRRHLRGDQLKLLIGRTAKAMGPVLPHQRPNKVPAGNFTGPPLADRAKQLGVSKGTVSKAIKAVDQFDALPMDLASRSAASLSAE